MISFTDTFVWLSQNPGLTFVWLLCVAIVMQLVDWYLKFGLPQKVVEVSKWLMERPELGIAFLFVCVVISALALETRQLWSHSVATEGELAPWSGEATSTLRLVLGALITLYGGILAGRRLNISRRQAKTAESNLLNDRLKNGLTFLQSNNIETRCAGILLLQNYAMEVPYNSKEGETVVRTLVAFVRSRAKAPKNNASIDDTPNFLEWPLLAEENTERHDIEVAIQALVEIIPEYVEGRDEWSEISLTGLDLRYLEFSNLNLSGIKIDHSNLQNTKFSDCTFNKTGFWNSNLESAEFTDCKFSDNQFFGANLRNCQFYDAFFNGAMSFMLANLKGSFLELWTCDFVNFSGADLTNTQILFLHGYDEVNFQNSIFQSNCQPDIQVEFKKVCNASVGLSDNGIYDWGNGAERQRRVFEESFGGPNLDNVFFKWWHNDEQEENQK